MVLNLCSLEYCLFLPTLFWVKNTGPDAGKRNAAVLKKIKMSEDIYKKGLLHSLDR